MIPAEIYAQVRALRAKLSPAQPTPDQRAVVEAGFRNIKPQPLPASQ